jgi:hypothetical protein
MATEYFCKQCNKSFSDNKQRVFCSRACYSAYQRKGTLPWYKGGKIDVTCENCGNSFKADPHQKGKVRYCSNACRVAGNRGYSFSRKLPPTAQIVAEYDAGDALWDIANRYGASATAVAYHLKKAGRKARPQTGANFNRPEVREKTNALNRQRLGLAHPTYIDLPIEQVAEEYKEGATSAFLGRKYGVCAEVITRRLRAAGSVIRSPGYSRFRNCKDGHRVQSRLEQWVDNWLFDHHIPHEVQVSPPWSKRQKIDFRLSETVYLEVWGMQHNPKYEQRKAEKQRRFKEAGLTLIEMYPDQIMNNDFAVLEHLIIRKV